MRYVWAILASITILIVFIMIKVFYGVIISKYQEEHVHELSKEMYVLLGVSELIPIIIAIVLIRIVWKKITYKEQSINNLHTEKLSLVKAVYNHSKDIASEIKPTLDEYKKKHTNQTSIINNEEAYEQALNEIEEDNKVKSTWAKALAQCQGNKDKAESIYINLRVIALSKTDKKSEQKQLNVSNKLLDKNTFPDPNLLTEETHIENKLNEFLEQEGLETIMELTATEVIASSINNSLELKLIYQDGNWIIKDILENGLSLSNIETETNNSNQLIEYNRSKITLNEEIELLKIKKDEKLISSFENARLEYLLDYEKKKENT